MRVFLCPHIRRSRLFALPSARDFNIGQLLLGLAFGSWRWPLPDEGYKEYQLLHISYLRNP